ncbi:ABC transporter permease [Roseivirga sp.]|uniref:ABC transporter permease n=1 Tax=Roseivirga sp. TaxID=1964215 RepID=UPI003B8D2E8A
MIISKHYFNSAITNFKRNKWYTSLMVLSLAAGMFCFILASSYVSFEYSRNGSHENAERVFLISLGGSNEKIGNSLTADFAERLQTINPNIEAVNILDSDGRFYLSANGRDYIEQEQAFYSNTALFDVFTFPLKYGDAKTALNGSRKVVISNQIAETLYEGMNPIGKELIVHEKGTYLVSGVLEAGSDKSLINPKLIFPRPQIPEKYIARTGSFEIGLTHIKIAKGADIEEIKDAIYSDYQSIYKNERVKKILAEPLTEAYWGYSHYDYGRDHYSLTGANKGMIKTIGYISIGILLCSFVGYLSLSLGMSLKRAKEIGIRKVNGARKSDIKTQLLLESIFYAMLSLSLVLVFLELFGSSFSKLFGIPIGFSFNNPLLLFGLIGFAILTGLLAGFYPAFVVSKLNPVKVLTGYNTKTGAGFRLKQGLLLVQFVMTITLVFFVYGQNLQVKKMQGFDFGFDKEGIVAFQLLRNKNILTNFESVVSDIKKIEGINDISGGPFPFSFNGFSQYQYDKGDSLIKNSVSKVLVKDNFFETMQVKLSSGSTFLNSSVPSSQACIINAPFAQALGGDVLGTTLNVKGQPLTIIGVVDNYVDLGINHLGTDPRLFLVTDKPNYHSILIDHDTKYTAELMAKLEGVWRKHEQVIPPSLTYLLDEEDATTSGLQDKTALFTFLAAVLLILSLFNLLGVSVSYATDEIKNISIRRVLGAETMTLFLKLLSPFFKVLAIGIGIALPLAYWFTNQYLTDYKVRIELTAYHGLVISVLMATILFIMIGYQLFRISRINPVETLKEN